MYVSTDEGNTFNEAIFPLQGRANHFKVVDASEGMVMAAVQHSYTRVEGIWRVVVYDAGVVVGNYSTQKALFSPAETADTEAADMFLQSTGANACEKVDAGAKGKIVVIVRGECHFNVKVQNAEDAGAVGVVVINSDDKLFRMGGGNEDAPQQIPSYLITKSDGDALNALFRDSQGGRPVCHQRQQTPSLTEGPWRPMPVTTSHVISPPCTSMHPMHVTFAPSRL